MWRPLTSLDATRADKHPRDNAMDLVRLGAALLVIVSHAFEFSGVPHEGEPFMALTGGQLTFGRLGVAVFFILSGYLITESFLRAENRASFLAARICRIYPLLFVVVIVSVFVVGPLLSTLSLGDYFSDQKTWAYLVNLTLFNKFDELPGVFENNPYGAVFNAPLWTLKFEIMCYTVCFLLGVAGLLRERFLVPLTAGAIILKIALFDIFRFELWLLPGYVRRVVFLFRRGNVVVRIAGAAHF